ncbi:hypothetical protein [Jeotgalibacillus soli]|uniref:Uncharacterized protein n=1 Tax=Jeotgalibacillus soli TaxID=889306 RepID=A0A0C2VUW8_9BACL|nr:hypothetical protein [Jeotgalibacillus soli]KIL48226.1 hypothetical protein KP78_16730 [Jeotgalibacillus soli]
MRENHFFEFIFKNKKIIVVSLWNPQIIERLPKEVPAYITTYSYTDHVIKQLKALLEGLISFKGKSSVTLLEQGSYTYEQLNTNY